MKSSRGLGPHRKVEPRKPPGEKPGTSGPSRGPLHPTAVGQSENRDVETDAKGARRTIGPGGGKGAPFSTLTAQ